MSQGPETYYVKDLYEFTAALDEFSRCLDRQFRIINNWEHFAKTLNVPSAVIRTCKLYSEDSPTIRLFRYLEVINPYMTVGELRAALSKNQQRARHDLARLLEDMDNELKISQAITNSTSNIMDKIASKLDSASPPTCTWMDVGLEIGITRDTLQQLEKGPIYNPTEALFRVLYTGARNVKASVVVDYLNQMNRWDILEELKQIPQSTEFDSKVAQDIFKLGSEVLDRMSRRLNKDFPGVEGWKGLASRFLSDQYIDDPDIISKLEPPHQHEIHSPTKKVIEWLTANKPEVTVNELIQTCRKIARYDVAEILSKHYNVEGSWDDPGSPKSPSPVQECSQVPTSTPFEIVLRGAKAIEAYEKELLDGKTKNRRLFVMLIGQSRAGKTSLLKSFRGLDFDPNEDSTECAVLHRCCCKLVDTVWVPDSDIEDKMSFEGVMSKKMAETYQGEEKSHSDMKTSKEASGRDKSLDKNDRPDEIHSSLHTKLDGSAEVDESTQLDDSTERSGPNGKLSDSLQNPVDGEDSSSLANRVETKDEVFKRVNNNLRNPKEAGSDDIICSVLDIGGQPVYEVTHPLFISTKGVFLLVHSLKNGTYNKAAPCAENQNKRRELDDKCCMTNMDHLEFWLSFVELNSAGVFKDASKECELMPKKLPPVFLACTHADKPFHGEVAEEMSRDILKDLKREEHPPGKHLVRSLYVINNTVSGSSEDEGVKKLRKEICDVAKSLPHMNEDIPINWFAFEKELKFLLQKKRRYLSIEEAKEIALNCKVNVDVKSNQFITLLNYLHDIREIIYFEGSQTVFIDIQWLIDMIGKVITVELYENRKEKHDNSWKKLEEEGVLDWSLLKHVWSDELADDEATIGDLLGIMERFSLLYRWKIEVEQNVFLVPAMLLNSNAQNIAELLKDQITPIIVYFPSSHLPLGIFPRLQVMFAEFCNQKWPRSSQPKFNHNFCRFFKVGEEASFDLVLTSDVKTISVGVVVRKADNLKIMDFCQEILEFLRTKLEVDMRKNFPWMKNMDYQLSIRCPICQPSANCKQPHCPGCTSNACVHFISGEEVLKEEDLSCEKNPVCRNTDIQYEYYFHWFPKSGKPIPSKPVPKDISSRSGAFNMNEENKRWVVVGIAIMKDLLPILRSYIKPEISKHYNDLKAKHNIDTQITGKHLEKDGSFKFNYESINNNHTKKKPKLYDCKVNSEADLAKLYCKSFMAKFTAIDESCDLSAVLGILSSASVFTVATQDAAKEVRQHVRNDWGHCNFAEWNDVKFQHCFQLMDDLIKTLNLADDEEKKLLEKLKDWKEKGVQLCLGSPVDADLLKVVQNDVVWLMEELQYLKEGDSEEREELKRVTRALDEFRTEVFKILKEHETRITDVECRVKALEDERT